MTEKNYKFIHLNTNMLRAQKQKISKKVKINFGKFEKASTFVLGEVAEWSIAAVLKTVEC